MSELIQENVDFLSIENEIIEEQKGPVKNKIFYIKGPFLTAEQINGNKRIYPRSIIEREINSHFKDKIKESRALGELGHPSNAEINLDRVSHLITELEMEGNQAIGKAKLLDTPMGKIAKSLIESGVKLGVSSRGVGSVKNGIVQNDFKLLTVDIVADPSGPGCYVEGILENKEWVIENGILVEKEINELKNKVDKIVVEHKFLVDDKKIAFLKTFQDILEDLKNKI